MAPFDVRLPKGNEKDDDIRTVVQPDLTVVCDRGKLDDKGCKGSPDLVVEIVSPSSFRHDVLTKLRLYEKAGVREYWIVYPGEKAVVVYKLNASGKYGEIEPYAAEDTLKVGIFDDLDIHLETVFAE
jgi:Uma2 family endonuclease